MKFSVMVGFLSLLLFAPAQADEIELRRIDAGCGTCRHPAWQLAGLEQHGLFAATDGQRHLEPFRIDQFSFCRQAYEMDRMAAEQQLGCEQ